MLDVENLPFSFSALFHTLRRSFSSVRTWSLRDAFSALRASTCCRRRLCVLLQRDSRLRKSSWSTFNCCFRAWYRHKQSLLKHIKQLIIISKIDSVHMILFKKMIINPDLDLISFLFIRSCSHSCCMLFKKLPFTLQFLVFLALKLLPFCNFLHPLLFKFGLFFSVWENFYLNSFQIICFRHDK